MDSNSEVSKMLSIIILPSRSGPNRSEPDTYELKIYERIVIFFEQKKIYLSLSDSNIFLQQQQ